MSFIGSFSKRFLTFYIRIYLGGAPNGAAIGPDGWIYICNNGGFSLIH